MKRRQIIILLSGVVILAICIVIARSLNKDEVVPENESNSATAVKTINVSPGLVHREILITGRLVPENSVMIYAEVGGIASIGKKRFKEGIGFKEGELMLTINSDEIESSLIAGRSNFQSLLASVIPDLKLDFPDVASEWENYLFKIEIDKVLPKLPEASDKKLKLFLSGRTVFSNYYNIRELETRLEKYKVRAPFDGSLVSSNLDDQSLVRVGQPLGEFISSGTYELEAGVSYYDVEFLSLGTEFELYDVNTGKAFQAKVIRITDQVDQKTQQVLIFSRIKDSAGKSGIYLSGNIKANDFEDAFEIPVTSLINNSQIFEVKDGIAHLKDINVEYKNNEIAIVSGPSTPLTVIVGNYNESLNGLPVSIVNIAE